MSTNTGTATATATEIKPVVEDTNSSPVPTAVTTNNDEKIREAKALSKLIEADLSFINAASKRIATYKDVIEKASKIFEDLKKKNDNPDELRLFKKDVKLLKQKISSKQKDETEKDSEELSRQLDSIASANITGANADKVFANMPNLYKNTDFERTLEFKEFQARYYELSNDLKQCLLCFSVFPENVEIKKRVMIYWWIGEGFVKETQDTTIKKRAEEYANEFFKELIHKGFIEPVCEKPSLGVDSCKIHPFVRSMLIKIAKKINFFDFDQEGNVKEDYNDSLRACLTGKGLANRIDDLEKLHSLFNVSEGILELKPEWFSRMKNVNVIYLGRWQATATHHIEVEDTTIMKMKNVNVLDGLENIKHVKFLSLQGISRIMVLPDSITKLTSLTILDIRACHNLEEIPVGIGLLKNLTHLDMSECYLLDHMPKGLALLSKLQVLGGFVIVEESEGSKKSCTLYDLQKLGELRKLSIHTGVNGFPSDTDLYALNQFQALTKLTIAWGRGSVQAKKDSAAAGKSSGMPNNENGEAYKKKSVKATGAAKKLARLRSKQGVEVSPFLPPKLKKLDLQCFPGMDTPNWLKARHLTNLEKLYIRGGKFSDLGQFLEFEHEGTEEEAIVRAVKWGVEVLRLKYLTELEMDWMELRELFPKLTYLEMVNCPKLSMFPCDGSGVWMK